MIRTLNLSLPLFKVDGNRLDLFTENGALKAIYDELTEAYKERTDLVDRTVILLMEKNGCITLVQCEITKHYINDKNYWCMHGKNALIIKIALDILLEPYEIMNYIMQPEDD